MLLTCALCRNAHPVALLLGTQFPCMSQCFVCSLACFRHQDLVICYYALCCSKHKYHSDQIPSETHHTSFDADTITDMSCCISCQACLHLQIAIESMVSCRARATAFAASQSSMRAATEQAEHIKDHKNLVRRFQTAAQPPLPQEDAKGAPTAAQQRPRTAAEPRKVSQVLSVISGLPLCAEAPDGINFSCLLSVIFVQCCLPRLLMNGRRCKQRSCQDTWWRGVC